MEKIIKRKLFLVDDDALFLKTLEIQFLETGNFDVETFPTGEQCLENLHKNPALVILDYHLDGIDPTAMNGIKTLDKIKETDHTIPVIMLSSQDKIEVAVSCMHHKAFDYVVKSETAFVRLEKAIEAILKYNKMEKELNWYMNRM
jgi:two-component system, OmpR family, response regulator